MKLIKTKHYVNGSKGLEGNLKGSFICTNPQTGQYIPWSFLLYLWSSGSIMRDQSNDISHHERMLYHGATPSLLSISIF